MSERKKAKKPTENVRKYIKWVWILVAGPVGFLFFVVGCTSLGLFGKLPTFEELENPKSNLASEIIAADQKVIGKFYVQNRSNVHYEEISPTVINALVATEDARFTSHSGVDLRALFRVIFKTLLGLDSDAGGGSTLTQQLAKNLFPREKQNKLQIIVRKIKEWVIAVKLERNYTKNEILAMYLNTVEYGNQAFGIKSASKIFFNTTPDALKQEEAAVLVGVLKGPTLYNPFRNYENSINRRNTVLGQMLKYKYLSKEQFDSLKVIPIDLTRFQPEDHNSGLATYFREFLRDELTEWCRNHEKPDGTKYNLYKDGLKIYTTINSKMQEYAEQAVKEHLTDLQKQFFTHWKGYKNAPFAYIQKDKIDQIMMQSIKRSDRYRVMKKEGIGEKEIMEELKKPVKMKIFTWRGDSTVTMSPIDSIRYHKYFLQTGMMAMEPQTGYIRAWVGGINHQYFKYDHVYASKRQVGSTFKPIVYAVAMQNGMSPCTQVPNVPICIETPSGPWCPDNSSKDYEGSMVSLKAALASSINRVSAYLINKYGVESVVSLAKKLGITEKIPAVPSISLGTTDLSVYEMVGAMAAFVNEGVHITPQWITRIEDKNGNVIEEFLPKMEEALDEQTAFLVVELMKGVVEGGTATRLRGRYGLTNPIAGKTGTTQNNSDGWFMGLTPELVAGVWVGCEDRAAHFRSTALGQGANMALPIWGLFMKKVYDDKTLKVSKGNFKRPEKLSVEIDCGQFQQDIKTNENFENFDK
jgi:penicillin-binding protein 1A